MTQKVSAIGTTTIDGETKVRFTNDIVTRSKSWQRSGVDVELISLTEPLERLEALKFIQTHDKFQSPEQQRAILEQIILKEADIKRTERRIKRQARKSGEASFSLNEIRSRKVPAEA